MSILLLYSIHIKSYFAPKPRMTAGTVRSRILKSRASDQRLYVEQNGPKRHDHYQKPLIVLEWADRFAQVEPGGAVITERVRGEQ